MKGNRFFFINNSHPCPAKCVKQSDDFKILLDMHFQ